jgi:predicted alpha/beta-fold hydrolase
MGELQFLTEFSFNSRPFSSHSSQNYETFKLNQTQNLLEHPDYDRNLPTVLYVHGYTESFHSKSTQTVVEAFIARQNHNILVLDWSTYSKGLYTWTASRNVYPVGERAAEALLKMQNQGFNLQSFNLVGHSLGSHVVGVAGRNVQRKSKSQTSITRITALDPAGPMFYKFGAMFHKPLNENDALFVDVIHTDYSYFGTFEKCGDAGERELR